MESTITITRAEARARAIEHTVAKVREIERMQGVNPQALQQIKAELIALAACVDIFPLEDFPSPQNGSGKPSCLYRLSEDEDHRFALYANSTHQRYVTAPHNHSTWAVIVGVHGEEPNRFYRRTEDGGVEEAGGEIVRHGTGVTFMPSDLHSLDIKGEAPMLNFHMYGLALEQLHLRQYYTAREHVWRHYPAHSDIREARHGR
ncbi:MAG: cysteine dioxygenase [Betaproteobacteria bacterium]|nr:cysteine dioxygenase [Betaproteobacteria bacterium]